MLCSFAQFAFSSVFTMLIPTLPIYLSRSETKEAEIGLLIGIFSFSSLIFRPLVGRALSNIAERTFMMVGTLFYIFSSIAYLLAPPFWPLLVVRIFHGIGLAFFSTAIFTLVSNITPEMHRGQSISYFYLSGNIAFLLGPYLGILVVNRFNFVVLFLLCTGLSLCSLLITTKLGKKKGIPLRNESPKLQCILSREALPASTVTFLLNIIWGSVCAFFPLYALKNGVSNPGIFFIFSTIPLVLTRALGGKMLDLYDRRKVVMPCLTTIVVSMIILACSTTLPMFILVAMMMGTGWALVTPSLLVYAIENSGSARGSAMGTFTGLADFGLGIGPMIMGAVLQWTSYPMMFSCLSLVAVTSCLYFYFTFGRAGRR